MAHEPRCTCAFTHLLTHLLTQGERRLTLTLTLTLALSLTLALTLTLTLTLNPNPNPNPNPNQVSAAVLADKA